MTKWVVMGDAVKFTIPSLPPSKNLLHSIIRVTNRPLEFKRSTKYEKWLSESIIYIPTLAPKQDSYCFMLTADFYYPFNHPNGRHQRLDCHNFLEALCDAVARKNGFDDSYIKETHATAHDSQKKKVECELAQIRVKDA